MEGRTRPDQDHEQEAEEGWSLEGQGTRRTESCRGEQEEQEDSQQEFEGEGDRSQEEQVQWRGVFHLQLRWAHPGLRGPQSGRVLPPDM